MHLSNIYRKQVFIQILIWLTLIGAAILISVLFPVYFRNDDGTGLFWASSHNFLDAFSLDKATIGGTFRPVNYMFWWIMFHLFGHTAIYYQIVVTFLFLSNLYLFFLIIKEYGGLTIAFAALVIHILLFNDLYYVAFWFSDKTFTLQLTFTFLSILFFLKSKNKLSYIFLSYLFGALAFLTKEPSVIIILSFIISDYIVSYPKKDNNAQLIKVLPFILFAFLILIISPVIQSRTISTDLNISQIIDKIIFRSEFYYEYLTTGIRIIIPFLLVSVIVFSLGLRKLKLKGFLLYLIVIPSYFSSVYFYLLIVSTSFYACVYNRKALGSILWFSLTLFPLFFLDFFTQTYLYEFSYGFAMFLSIGLTKVIVDNKYFFRHQVVKSTFALIALLGIVFLGAQIKGKVKALLVVVEARQNFAAAVDYILINIVDTSQIILMDHKYVGDDSKRRHKLTNNITKAQQQQTMEIPNFKKFIKSFGLSNVDCLKYNSSLKNNKDAILFLQNNKDIKLAESYNIIGDTLFLKSCLGRNSVLISRIKTGKEEVFDSN